MTTLLLWLLAVWIATPWVVAGLAYAVARLVFGQARLVRYVDAPWWAPFYLHAPAFVDWITGAKVNEAITLGVAVFEWRLLTVRDVRHESIHVIQAVLLGPLFYLVYAYEQATEGYAGNDLEEQARRYAAAWSDTLAPVREEAR